MGGASQPAAPREQQGQESKVSYEYASTLFNTPHQASLAAVSDFLYASGNNSSETVASMNAAEATAELVDLLERNEWTIPYLDEHTHTVAEMVGKVICAAGEEVDAERDDA